MTFLESVLAGLRAANMPGADPIHQRQLLHTFGPILKNVNVADRPLELVAAYQDLQMRCFGQEVVKL